MRAIGRQDVAGDLPSVVTGEGLIDPAPEHQVQTEGEHEGDADDSRRGHQTPSGRLVVEEEVEERAHTW